MRTQRWKQLLSHITSYCTSHCTRNTHIRCWKSVSRAYREKIRNVWPRLLTHLRATGEYRLASTTNPYSKARVDLQLIFRNITNDSSTGCMQLELTSHFLTRWVPFYLFTISDSLCSFGGAGLSMVLLRSANSNRGAAFSSKKNSPHNDIDFQDLPVLILAVAPSPSWKPSKPNCCHHGQTSVASRK